MDELKELKLRNQHASFQEANYAFRVRSAGIALLMVHNENVCRGLEIEIVPKPAKLTVTFEKKQK